MGLKNRIVKAYDALVTEDKPVQPKSAFESFFDMPGNFQYTDIGTYSFNGEKNPGQAGPIIDYRMDFKRLRIRSWQAMTESDKAYVAVNRFIMWVIGKGLKPQIEPMISVLKDEGITLDKIMFSKSVEDRFNIFRKSSACDYAGMKNLNQLSVVAEKNAMVGGDVLVVLRYDGNKETIQLIDGENVESPRYGTQWFPESLPDGHRLIDGVEVDKNGKHIAFYVRTYAVTGDMKDIFSFSYERIEAYGEKSALQMAYLYYGSEHRINNVRGMPIISVFTEKLKKMEEYSDAALEQAKEAAKVNYQVEHELNAEGKAPWAKNTVQGMNTGFGPGANGNFPVTNDGVQLNKMVNVTSIGTAYNNPPGSKITMLKNENPLYFKEFMSVHANDFWAFIGIPPNVATGMYTDSYSASRAGIMDWLNTLLIKREWHTVGFLQPIFNFWLEIQIYKNRIQAPGYLKAKMEGNDFILAAYRSVRFLGKNPPHIDPLKEVLAARQKLGLAGANIPLDDVESVTEDLGCGNSIENIEQFAKELELTKSLGIKPDPIEQKVVNNTDDTEKDDKEDD